MVSSHADGFGFICPLLEITVSEMSAANPKTSALLNTTGDKRGNMFCCYYLEEPNPLKHVPVFLSQNWCLRSIQLRQKTKQVKASTAYSSSQIFPHAVWFLHLSLSLCFFFFFFFHTQPRVKTKTARSSRSVNTPARESPTAHVLRASTVTSVKVLYAWPRLTARCRQLGR